MLRLTIFTPPKSVQMRPGVDSAPWFFEPPAPEDAPNCAQAGVLGVLPGVIGLLQATEVLKLLLGIGEPLRGRLLQFDALKMRFRETRLAPDPDCAVCAPGREFPGYVALQALCAAPGAGPAA